MLFLPLEIVCDTVCENGLNHTSLFVDSAGRVHVAYHKRVGGVWQIFYRMKDSSWRAEQRVTFTASDAKYPSVVVARDSVFLVWHDYRIGGISNVELFFNSKPIYGDTWANEERLTYTSSGSAGDNSYLPSMKLQKDGSLRVVWYDYRDDPSAYNAQIYTKVRDGSTWSADVRVSDSPGNAWYPSFAGDSVLYVWADNRDGGYSIYGNSGYGDFQISTDGYYPDVAYAFGKYVLVWQGGDGNVYITSKDTSWRSPHPILPTGNQQKGPTVFPFSGGFVVAWREDYGAYESDIKGVILDRELSVLDTFRIEMPGIQERPTLFIDRGGFVHMTFVDRSYGSSYPKIFYTRSTFPLNVVEHKRRKKFLEVKSYLEGRKIILDGRYDTSGRRVR